jgi:hypothetical protein
MENGELVIVPEAVRLEDTICILSGTATACALRANIDGSWTLISGDCWIFTELFQLRDEWFIACDEHIACNKDKIEEFRIR